ncbi:MAG: YitT family protein [Acutalibacteraceae bacterium]
MKSEKIKNALIDVLFDIIGGAIYACGIYSFAKAADFAPGGLTGIGIILNHLFNLPIGITTFILNIPLVILSLKFIGKKFILKSIKTMIICTIFIDLVFPYFPAYSGSRLLAAMFSGILVGLALSLFYMRGSSSGGADFLTMTLKTVKPQFSIGTVTMIIDITVILLGWPVFKNVDTVLYGFISTILASTVIDKVMYGFNRGTLLMIITENGETVTQIIKNEIGRSSTKLNAIGTFTNTNKDLLLCACSNAQSHILKKAIFQADEKAFIMVTQTTDVLGEGFKPHFP